MKDFDEIDVEKEEKKNMKKKWLIFIVMIIFIVGVCCAYKLYTTDYYDKVKPEQITFYGSGGAVNANTGSYSWSKSILGQTLYVNACGISPLEMEYNNSLKIIKGSSISSDLSYNVTKITVYKYNGEQFEITENNLKYDLQNKKIDMSGLDTGIYIIELFAKDGTNNDVIYAFKLEVVDSIEYTGTSFYAKIKKINGTNLLVDGLDINNINYRGEISFEVDEGTKLEYQNTTIDILNFHQGDNVLITFKGDVKETYPLQINGVVKIQLLDGEK